MAARVWIGVLIGAAVGGGIGAAAHVGVLPGILVGSLVGGLAGLLSGGSPEEAPAPRLVRTRTAPPEYFEGTRTAPEEPAEGPWKRGQIIAGLFGDAFVITDVKRGGMGAVLLCFGSRWGRALALKTYSDGSEFARDAFRREAENWVRLGRHPNVVRAHTLIERDQRLFIATEFIPRHPRHGTDLGEWIATRGLDLALSLDFAIQICRGLEHAADCFPGGFVHRDLKPSNILIHPDGQAKITDFGISRSLPRDRILRSTAFESGADVTVMKGTPTIMSPEQWTEGAPIDARSDVYSFGCVLFEMLTGRRVFLASAAGELARQHQSEEPPRVRDLNAGVSEPLERVVLRCLRKNPDDRYPDFRSVRQDLEAATGVTVRVTTPAATDTPPALINRAHDLLVLKKAQEALELLNQALEKEPANPSVWINRAAARGMLGDPRGELEDLSHAQSLDPRSHVIYRNRAMCRMKMGDFASALLDFQEAHRILPPEVDPALGPKDRANHLFAVGCLKLFEGDAGAAEESLTRAMELNPDHPEAQALRSQAKLAQGDSEAALEDLSAAIARHPDHAVAWCFRAHVKNQLEDYEGAEHDASEAIERDPAFAHAFNNRAAARFNLKDFEGALADCDQSLRLHPDFGMPHLNRANALLELKRLSEAAEAYERALRAGLVAPWDTVARTGLRFIREGRGG